MDYTDYSWNSYHFCTFVVSMKLCLKFIYSQWVSWQRQQHGCVLSLFVSCLKFAMKILSLPCHLWAQIFYFSINQRESILRVRHFED